MCGKGDSYDLSLPLIKAIILSKHVKVAWYE